MGDFVRQAADDDIDEHSAKHQAQVTADIQSIPDDITIIPFQPPSDSTRTEDEQDDNEAHEQEVDEEEEEEEDRGSYYWDAATMTPLNAASAAAIARLRAFKPPPFPLWDRLPVSRRAAVLMLLYADRRGDLRVVITMRAASLRSFSGHAALPGGKADTLEETPYQIARREAWEEIGLPMDDSRIPAPFRIEHLCYLPFNLARTELVVRPCVALLHAAEPPVPTSSTVVTPTVEESLIPKLDAKEVAAVFSAPFHNFLRSRDEVHADEQRKVPAGKWYEGSWAHWHEEPWRMHFFYVPVTNQRVTKPKLRDGGLASIAEHTEDDMDEETPGRYKVWGMTARILVDAATVAYGEEPEFEHNSHFGDEQMIDGLEKLGRLGPKKRPGSELTSEDLKKAAKEAAKM
ncbi:NUDIX hydrolase domain-like protein [Diplogelasinospora grovesii]|uniref:NUDIX hydrolase domain-like protein n=1 Tax=Diplogelasinospora grovesii TaxID=303347 RepID=A0AAN6NAH8_9PEZI|nr:NUDIX hydrolase domain-like protein [Diplogelasinospora grovesii]